MRFFSKRLTHTQTLAVGFFLIIIMGSILLMLPISSKDGMWTSFSDTLFTSTSATCVTGLIIADTFTKWSFFGQLVILCMIQVGGLGFMIVGVGFAIIFHHKIGLWTRGTLQESVNIDRLGGIVRLTKRAIRSTLVIEGIGAVILALRFMKDLPIHRAVYFGIFHSISAFCNAGFDLMGCFEPYGSLIPYQKDIIVNVVIMALIVAGGIGFFVWNDIYENGLFFKRYTLQTKLVLSITTILIVGGAACFFLFERGNAAYSGLNTGEQIMAAFFNSITARTAGFNSTDTALLSSSSKLLTIVLMFIGGSPGSTAGGIKTTTCAVMLLSVMATLRGKSIHIFKRKIDDPVVKKATVVLSLNLTLIVIAIIVMNYVQQLPTLSSTFEVVSAMGTVGMSTGITRDLNQINRIIIILLMYFGRVGSMTFALSFLGKRKSTNIHFPVENVNVG